CTGTAYGNLGTTSASLVSLLVGPSRVVFRSGTDISTWSPPRVWKSTSTTETVPVAVPTYYQLDGVSGACAAVGVGAPVTGNTLVALASIPAPPQPVAPLSLG